jgi:serine/threonine-protein kinase
MEMPAETSMVGFEAAFSPDGKFLVYVAGTGSNRGIHLRAMNQIETKPIPGTERASDLFFSPDGQWIGFHDHAGFTLKKISVSGGASITLCDAPSLARGTWGTDETIVFGQRTGGLMRVAALGGTPEELTSLSPNEESHGWPHSLPGERALLFASIPRGSSVGETNIEVLDLGSGERKVVYRGGIVPSYLPTGHMAFYAEGTLFVAPFDLERRGISGTPVPVLENVDYSPSAMMASYAFSASGTLLYLPEGLGCRAPC